MYFGSVSQLSVMFYSCFNTKNRTRKESKYWSHIPHVEKKIQLQMNANAGSQIWSNMSQKAILSHQCSRQKHKLGCMLVACFFLYFWWFGNFVTPSKPCWSWSVWSGALVAVLMQLWGSETLVSVLVLIEVCVPALLQLLITNAQRRCCSFSYIYRSR